MYRRVFLALTMSTLLSGGQAYAASYGLQEYSVRDLGQANAGFAALGEDASTVYSNPAGLARLDKPEFVSGVTGILPHSKFVDGGSTLVNTLPQTGVADRGLVGSAAIPSFFAALPLSDRVTLGLGVTVPFAMMIDYDPHWIGRYQATNSTLQSVDINPALGIRLADGVSVGFGVSAQYFKSRLSNAIDAGLLLGGAGASGTADGSVDLVVSDWGIGFNAGVMVDLAPRTRLGVNFRSKVKHNLHGYADFTINPLIPLATGAFVDTPVRSSVEMPASYAVSIHHDATDKLALMASLLYTRWSSFDKLEVTYANPNQPTTTELYNSRNTLRGAIGARYKLCENFSINAGIAYDQTPTETGFESARLPDASRFVGATGFSWTPKPGLAIEFAYQHLELKKLNIDRTGPLGDQLTGQYRTSAELVGLSVRLQY